MVRSAVAVPSPSPRWHKVFLAMLPKIIVHARVAFRHLKGEAREDAVQEVIANSLVAFCRLVRLKKTALAYPTVLARYAVAQINDGRRVGNKLNIREVLSGYAQKNKGFKVERLDKYDSSSGEWEEIIIEDRHTTPADVVRVRLDFRDWLRTLKRRDRKIAQFLGLGNRTSDVAKKFKVSEGRVSQLRRELAESWAQFVGDKPDSAAA